MLRLKVFCPKLVWKAVSHVRQFPAYETAIPLVYNAAIGSINMSMPLNRRKLRFAPKWALNACVKADLWKEFEYPMPDTIITSASLFVRYPPTYEVRLKRYDASRFIA